MTQARRPARLSFLELAFAGAIPHDHPVNSASQNRAHHLGALQQNIRHATGLMALIPGVNGGTEVGRFRVTDAPPGNPKHK